jgi:hypothetical protein
VTLTNLSTTSTHHTFLVPQSSHFLQFIIPNTANMSNNDVTRLPPPDESDPLRAKLAYHTYHYLRTVRDEWAQLGYMLSDHLVELFELPVVRYAEFALAILPPSIQLEWVAQERDKYTRAMDWFANEYVRIIVDDCKRKAPFCLFWHHLKAFR